MQSHKTNVQHRFGQSAQAYVQSTIFSSGEDLDWLLSFAQDSPFRHVLDVATGGGHTASQFAQHAEQVVASDFTLPMLEATRRAFPTSNIAYHAVDAEHLPYRDNTFDVVSCRLAAHHFGDCFRFVTESSRCLIPDGLLLIVDHLNPDTPADAAYIDSFERLRDPSHHRAYADYEWRGMMLDAGLDIVDVRHVQRPADGLMAWAKRQQRPNEVIEKLQLMLMQAPVRVREFLEPRYLGTPDADFLHNFILIAGRKPL